MTAKIGRSVSLYSYQQEYYEGRMNLEDCIRAASEAGATGIVNLAASSEVVGNAAYRRQLVVSQSGRLCCGYVFANAGEGESTTDLVFGGHCLIVSGGEVKTGAGKPPQIKSITLNLRRF